MIGEDALANLSVEKEGEDGPVTGFMRIRSRSQGLALSLGILVVFSNLHDSVTLFPNTGFQSMTFENRNIF